MHGKIFFYGLGLQCRGSGISERQRGVELIFHFILPSTIRSRLEKIFHISLQNFSISDVPVSGPGQETARSIFKGTETNRKQDFRKMEDREMTENRTQKKQSVSKKNLVQKWRLFGKNIYGFSEKGTFWKILRFFFSKKETFWKIFDFFPEKMTFKKILRPKTLKPVPDIVKPDTDRKPDLRKTKDRNRPKTG